MRNIIFHCLIVVAVVGSVGANPGYLEVENNLNSYARNVYMGRDDINFPGATDNYDTHDIPNLLPPSGTDIYTNIVTHTLGDDFRDENSIADYDIRLFYNGSLPAIQSNWVEFSFPYTVNPFTGTGDYTFGEKEITFSSNRLPYGSVVDVRKVINQNGGVLPLIDVPAGTSGEYATGILTIGTRKLADLSDNGDIDLLDFSMLAEDWQNPIQGQYIGDITGEYGIPDGYVDMWDLEEFMSEWLEYKYYFFLFR